MSGRMNKRLEVRADGLLLELKYYAENGAAMPVATEQLVTA